MGGFFLASATENWYTASHELPYPFVKEVGSVFPFLHPRVPDFVLGLTIGLSLALAWHWVAWTVR